MYHMDNFKVFYQNLCKDWNLPLWSQTQSKEAGKYVCQLLIETQMLWQKPATREMGFECAREETHHVTTRSNCRNGYTYQ